MDDTHQFTVTLFMHLPLGTRFLYKEAFWIKLADDAAQCESGTRAVHTFSPQAACLTA